MKHLIHLMSLIVAVCFGALSMQSCANGGNGDDDDDDYVSKIDGPKWVLVDFVAPDYTDRDVKDGNANKYNPVYHTDSLKMEATKKSCIGFYAESYQGPPGDDWNGGAYLFRYEVTQIPRELEGGGTITLYNKVSLPVHLGGGDNDNSYAQWSHYHCSRWIDCRIDGNKIRAKESDYSKCGGYNVPIVMMNNNEPDLFKSEAPIYGEVPMGRNAGDKIKLTISASEISLNGKDMTATYTYEWRVD